MPAIKIRFAPGTKQDRLTIMKEAGKGKHGHILWFCECECGNQKRIAGASLKRGAKSCGCLTRERNTKHGLSATRLYRLWSDIKRRCCCPTDKAYKNYGGRGIRIYDSWKDDPEAFIKWVEETLGERPTKKHSLDRIDVNDDYKPGNLRWATSREQARNKRADNQVHPEFYKLLTEPLVFTYAEEKGGLLA